MASQRVLPVDDPHETVVKYLVGNVGEAREHDEASTHTPHTSDTAGASSQKAASPHVHLPPVPRGPPPLLKKADSKMSTRELRKGSTLRDLNLGNNSPNNKLRARERHDAIIARKSLPSKKHSVLDIVAYYLDVYISTRRGQMTTLVVVGIVVVFVGGSILKPAEEDPFGTTLWQAWTFFADPGSQAGLALPVRWLLHPLQRQVA